MASPSDKPPPVVPVDDLAPTPIEELVLDDDTEAKLKDEEDDGGEGKSGSKEGGGGKKPGVPSGLKENEEDLSEYDSETLIEKLKMLVWAPFSAMVPGASAFESEQDLKRKLFLGQLGMITNQIDPQDIADPEFINRLEQRNQMRQQKNGIDVATVGSAAGLGGAVAALAEKPKEQQRKQDVKLQAQQPKEASLDARQEAEDKDPQAAQRERLEQQQRAEAKPATAPEAEENSFAAEIEKKEASDAQDRAQPKEDGISLGEIVHILDQQKEAKAETSGIDAGEILKGATGLSAMADLFNHAAQQMEYSAPEQKVDLKFADPAPKMAAASPFGGA